MQGLLRVAFCAALFSTMQASLAATVFRCEDASGHITFTRHGCPTGQQQQTQNAKNQTPGNGKAVPLAKTRDSAPASEHSELVVVGEKDDGCGNRITGSARRAAIIRQEISSGMTRSDVESSLGKPHKISRKNGQDRYHYRDNSGNTRQVSFDAAGCVRGK